MAYRKWTVEIDGRFHQVELETKGMGKRLVRVDGVQQVEEKKLINTGSSDEIRVGTHAAQVKISPSIQTIYELQFPEAQLPDPATQISVHAPQTERTSAEKDPAGLSLVVDTRTAGGYFLSLLGLALTAFGIYYFISTKVLVLSQYLVGAVILLTGLYLVYDGLRSALNRTTYRVSRQELVVRQAPIPAVGNRQLDPAQFIAVDVIRVVHRNRTRNSYSSTTSYTYLIQVPTQDSKRAISIGVYKKRDDAIFVADQIGRYLSLPVNTSGV